MSNALAAARQTNDGNLGMRFIRSLSKQINGTPKWISDPLGVHFELSFRR